MSEAKGSKGMELDIAGLETAGRNEFLKRCDVAELNAYDDLGTIRQGENAALRVMERRAKRLGANDAWLYG